LVLSPQILSEFIAVVTNPNVMPKPLPPTDAYVTVEALATGFDLIVPTQGVVGRALELLRATGISGKRVHDVMHAATMLENGVTQIYSLDEGFAKIPGITVLKP
jgi:predicted nucleic acid-binding protein